MSWYSNPAVYSAAAALFSLLVAITNFQVTRNSFEFNKMTAKRNLMRDLAARCNRNIDNLGYLAPIEGVLADIYTVCITTKKELEKVENQDDRKDLKSHFWCNLHSSIWVEIKESPRLKELKKNNPDGNEVLDKLSRQHLDINKFFVK